MYRGTVWVARKEEPTSSTSARRAEVHGLAEMLIAWLVDYLAELPVAERPLDDRLDLDRVAVNQTFAFDAPDLYLRFERIKHGIGSLPVTVEMTLGIQSALDVLVPVAASIPPSMKPRTSTFGNQRTQPRRSSPMSCSTGSPVSTGYALMSSSCRLPPRWKTFEHDVV